MQVGKLRNKVEIWGKVKALNELNQTTYKDGKVASVYAEIVPQTGNMQRQQVETMLTNVTHKFVCRYSKTVMSAYQQQQKKGNMHIMYHGHRFNVIYILNPSFRNEKMEIFTTEVIG